MLATGSDNETLTAACFQNALDISRRQCAKSLELRAAMSMARFWQREDKHDAAHKLLGGIFTKGLTKDSIRWICWRQGDC